MVTAMTFSVLALAQEPIFRVPVRVVSTPAVVVGADGKFVRGLGAGDFRLFDNDVLQKIRVDSVEEPVSIAVVVQTNRAVRAWLPEVRRMSGALETLVAGETGEASLTSFSDEVREIQPLTASAEDLDRGFASLSATGFGSRCLDAVMMATKRLEARPSARRRVILLIAQAGDSGSAVKLRDVLRELEANDIAVFTLAMPQVGADLVGSTVRVRGMNARDVGFIGSVDLGKLIPEIFRGGTGKDPASVLSAEMGGRRIPFRKLKDLEGEISSIGEELHTEYLLSYSPERGDAVYHRIRVEVEKGKVRARPGYYLGE